MSVIVIADKVCIPDGVVDLESFRRWARSDEFPEHGWISYLDGEVWVDLSMEQVFTHNLVTTSFTIVLGNLVANGEMGYLFSDGVLFTNSTANVATEPDSIFVSYAACRTNRVRMIREVNDSCLELEGTPDMVLEIVSRHSVRKDTVRLRELYHRAGIAEYWLVDARGDAPRFDILRHTAEGYVATEPIEGWLASAVLGREFRLVRATDPLGNPQHTLEVK